MLRRVDGVWRHTATRAVSCLDFSKAVTISSSVQVKELEGLMELHDVHVTPSGKAGRGAVLQPGSPGQDSARSMPLQRSASPTTGAAAKAGVGSPQSGQQASAISINPNPSPANFLEL